MIAMAGTGTFLHDVRLHANSMAGLEEVGVPNRGKMTALFDRSQILLLFKQHSLLQGGWRLGSISAWESLCRWPTRGISS